MTTVTNIYYENNLDAFVALKMILCIMIAIGCCAQKRLFVKKKVSVTVIIQGFENRIIVHFYAYNLLYHMRRINRTPNFLCTCVGTIVSVSWEILHQLMNTKNKKNYFIEKN